MKIKVLSFGKTREEYLKKGISYYLNRVNFYSDVEWVELNFPSNKKSLHQHMKKLKNDLDNHYIVAMDEKGVEFSSKQFAGFIERMMVSGKERMTFILGGHDGLELELINKAHMTIALSRMTFTHQMVRLIFLEQLYRAFTIIKGEAYHH